MTGKMTHTHKWLLCFHLVETSRVFGRTAAAINPDAVDPDDVEMLQDMILAAVNDALKKGEETREAEMNKIGGGMGGMF